MWTQLAALFWNALQQSEAEMTQARLDDQRGANQDLVERRAKAHAERVAREAMLRAGLESQALEAQRQQPLIFFAGEGYPTYPNLDPMIGQAQAGAGEQYRAAVNAQAAANLDTPIPHGHSGLPAASLTPSPEAQTSPDWFAAVAGRTQG